MMEVNPIGPLPSQSPSFTAVESAGFDARLVIVPQHPTGAFLVEFARACYVEGDFRSPGGRTNAWLLDCRRRLGDGPTLRAVAAELARLIQAQGSDQVAGAGFGAYLLVGGILALHTQVARGVLIRPQAKRYGTATMIEGSLDIRRPVCLVDDILNSGASALEAVNKLRAYGCTDIRHLSVFCFDWGSGRRRLNEVGVSCECLAGVGKAGPDRARMSPARAGCLWLARAWRRGLERFR